MVLKFFRHIIAKSHVKRLNDDANFERAISYHLFHHSFMCNKQARCICRFILTLNIFWVLFASLFSGWASTAVKLLRSVESKDVFTLDAKQYKAKQPKFNVIDNLRKDFKRPLTSRLIA